MTSARRKPPAGRKADLEGYWTGEATGRRVASLVRRAGRVSVVPSAGQALSSTKSRVLELLEKAPDALWRYVRLGKGHLGIHVCTLEMRSGPVDDALVRVAAPGRCEARMSAAEVLELNRLFGELHSAMNDLPGYDQRKWLRAEVLLVKAFEDVMGHPEEGWLAAASSKVGTKTGGTHAPGP